MPFIFQIFFPVFLFFLFSYFLSLFLFLFFLFWFFFIIIIVIIYHHYYHGICKYRYLILYVYLILYFYRYRISILTGLFPYPHHTTSCSSSSIIYPYSPLHFYLHVSVHFNLFLLPILYVFLIFYFFLGEQLPLQALHVLCNRVTVDDGKPSLRVRIRCDDMELAADLVQDMARYEHSFPAINLQFCLPVFTYALDSTCQFLSP